MTVSVWRDARTRDVLTAVDVAIVGGGIAGIATARQCIRRGLSTAVVEARDLTAGATGRNAGFAMTGLADPYEALIETHGRARARAIWSVSQANLRELVDEVVGQEGVACDLVPCGSVVAAWDEEEAAGIERSAKLLREDGFAVDVLNGEGVTAKLGSTRFANGLWVAGDHGVHPVKLVRGIAAHVQRAGVEILEHHEVRAFESSADHVDVHTSRGVVRAGRVILATNAYSRLLDGYFASRVRPVRGQALALGPVAPILRAMVYTDDGFQYARQLPDGTVVAGGWRRPYAEQEVGFGDEATPEVQDGIESFVRACWPQWSTAPITHRWSGTMGFSNDGLPIVGMLPDRPRVAFAVGFTGHGMGFALAAARAVVDVVTGTGDAGLFAER